MDPATSLTERRTASGLGGGAAIVAAFLALATIRLWILGQEHFVRTSLETGSWPVVLAYTVGTFAPLLLPAVVVARDPEVWARNRTLLLGAAVLGLGQAVGALLTLVLPSAMASFALAGGAPVDGLIVVGTLIAVSGPLGAYLIARAVRRSRRLGDAPSSIWALAVALLGLILAVSAVAGWSRMLQVPGSAELAILAYPATQLVINVAAIVVWTYFTVTMLRGVRAGEDPRSGWLLGMLAGLPAVVVSGILYTLVADAIRVTDLPSVAVATTVSEAPRHVFLLVAFAAGLPRPILAGAARVTPPAEAGSPDFEGS